MYKTISPRFCWLLASCIISNEKKLNIINSIHLKAKKAIKRLSYYWLVFNHSNFQLIVKTFDFHNNVNKSNWIKRHLLYKRVKVNFNFVYIWSKNCLLENKTIKGKQTFDLPLHKCINASKPFINELIYQKKCHSKW